MTMRTAMVVALAAASAFSSFPSAFYQQLPPDFGSAALTTALLFAAHGIAAALAMGVLARRQGARWISRFGTAPIIVVALLVDALGGAVLALAGDGSELAELLVGRLVTGAALGIVTVCATSVIVTAPRGSSVTTACILGGVGAGAVLSGGIAAFDLARSAVFVVGILLLLLAAGLVHSASGRTSDLSPARQETDSPGGTPAVPPIFTAAVAVAVTLAFVSNGVLGLFTSIVPGFVAAESGGAPLIAGLTAGTALLAAGAARVLLAPVESGVVRIIGFVALALGAAAFAYGMVASAIPSALVGGALLGGAAGIAYSTAIDLAARTAGPVRIRMLAQVQRGGQLGLVIPVLLFPLAAQR
ncbi:MFS transporter [Naasia lichenicola]|uniref:MFS transporter n=1 Tax=Naasia lichenicola TaxID=2565933 RepID=A0A4S4FGU5_9MICO|nr:MFS transporter [Naasia lichenicola]THG29341.1 MFS transporter [Naasia lichenicola]